MSVGEASAIGMVQVRKASSVERGWSWKDEKSGADHQTVPKPWSEAGGFERKDRGHHGGGFQTEFGVDVGQSSEEGSCHSLTITQQREDPQRSVLKRT